MGILDSLFGKSSSKTKIPGYIEDASKDVLNRAQSVANLGFVPYFGPDVAAFTPMQNAAMGNVNSMAGAFGMQTPSGGMPAPQTFAGGVQGYSSAPMWREALDELKQRRPGQYNALRALFMNPVTGKGGAASGAEAEQQAQQPPRFRNALEEYMWNQRQVRMGGGSNGNGEWRAGGNYTGGSGTPSLGGYSNVRDMFDGGGPGASGGAYQGGGLLSAAGNFRDGLRDAVRDFFG